MFSFRRKPKQPTGNQEARIPTSPSLPELLSQGIPWPENLVNKKELPPTPAPTGKRIEKPAGGTISSLYTSHPPSAFDNKKSSYNHRHRPSQKKSRNLTTFNVMVVGAQGTGKTSLLRLLVETAEVSPAATSEQRLAMDSFLSGMPKRTESIQSTSIEICESKYDRLLLSVIDTPGLDFREGHEFELERQIASVVRYLDTQFAETLSEESKVIRQSKGDQRVHLCIYTIDPSKVVRTSERLSSNYPASATSDSRSSGRSQATSESPCSEVRDSPDEVSMHPADIATLRRLVKKVNVLPVIARADSLTDDRLTEVKRVVRRDLEAAGLDFGVFAPAHQQQQSSNGPSGGGDQASGNGVETNPAAPDESDGEEGGEVGAMEARRSRPVIKLNPLRNPFKLRSSSRSRSRLELAEPVDEPSSVDMMDNESVASVRFSAQKVTNNLDDLLPFAVIAPETSHRRKLVEERQDGSDDMRSVHTDAGTSAVSPSDDGQAPGSTLTSPVSPVNGSANHASFAMSPPADLKGIFVRKFRWGTIDVLEPEHCDFAAMRTAVLSTHMKMLKIRTKEVLYEKFRTEKLLARRATHAIGEEGTRRMIEDLALL